MPQISVNGKAIHFSDQGRGEPLLLLHAFPLEGEMFRPQIDALAARHRVIVPDQRGFGQSESSEGPTEMSRMAQDALAILDSLEISTAIVGGISMGGYAAMAFLRQDPGRVAGLILIDTQAAADDEAGKQRREETAQKVLQLGPGVLVDSMLPKLLSPHAAAELKASVTTMILRATPAGVASAARGMALRSDSQDILARFGGPALILVGELDEITPPAKARDMADLIEGAQLIEIPGAGHLSTLEAPDAVNEAIQEFLAGRPSLGGNGSR